MPPIRRVARIAAAATGSVLYVWYAAVRYAPRVKQAKAKRRRHRS